ncbi:MAG: ATP-binding protein [Candidatus Bathycorpusculaceae bacterium]
MTGQAGLWYPTIFPEKCNGCEGLETPRCIQFCPNNVFEIYDGKAVVMRPQNCVYGCISCESVCPKKAIKFPQRMTSMMHVEVKDKGLLHKVKCKICGKVFWTNRETDICMDCEKR